MISNQNEVLNRRSYHGNKLTFKDFCCFLNDNNRGLNISCKKGNQKSKTNKLWSDHHYTISIRALSLPFSLSSYFSIYFNVLLKLNSVRQVNQCNKGGQEKLAVKIRENGGRWLGCPIPFTFCSQRSECGKNITTATGKLWIIERCEICLLITFEPAHTLSSKH